MKFTREFRPKDGNCFVLMPQGINPEGFDWDAHYREVVSSAIAEAGMTPIRADGLYSAQQQMIERIWKSIQEAEIIVADITGRDPDVMYELGLAHVIWKPVILLATEGSRVPDDLAQYPPVRYTTTGLGLVQLMRELKKVLQAVHAEPKAEEATLNPLPGCGFERISAKILTVAKDFAIVKAADGRKGILNAEDSHWIFQHPDLTRFKEGQEIDGAFVRDMKGEAKYSLIAVQDNPWDKLEERFPKDQEFTGIVVSKTKERIFVKMDFGINGFIPANTTLEHFEPNEEIRVKRGRVDRQARQVELHFVRKLLQSSAASSPQEEWNSFVGQHFDGKIVKIDSRGFVLVEITEDATGILHIRNMDEAVKKKFEANDLHVGDAINVEVLKVNKAERRLDLKSSGM